MSRAQTTSSRRGQALSSLVLAVAAISLTLLGGFRGILPVTEAPVRESAVAAAGSVVFVPAGAHSVGNNGANWRTDLEVHNPGTTAAAFTVALLKRDADNAAPSSKAYTLAPRQSRRFTDVMLGEFGFEGAAALRVNVSSGSVLVTSRTYNLVGVNPWKLPVGASFSQFVPGFDESAAIAYGQEGRLIHLTQQASSSLNGFRTNLGIVNTTGSPIDVRIDLYRSNGSFLGKKDGAETRLPAYGFRQLTEVMSPWGTIADGYAVVRTTTPGGRLFAFATVIDNHNSGDPVFIPAATVTSSVGTTPTPTPTKTTVPTPTKTTAPTPTKTTAPTPTKTGVPPSGMDLAPYKPSGWENPVVPDSQEGMLSTSFLSAHMTTYVRWAVANIGATDIPGPIRFELRIDGTRYTGWRNDAGLKAGFYTYVENYAIPYDTLTPGLHNLTIVADYDNAVSESNESNNAWGKSWEWTAILFVRAGEEDARERTAPPTARPDLPLASSRPVEEPVSRRASLAAATTPFYIPASAHATGLNGANWLTDLEVHNPGTTAATYSVTLLRQDTDNTTGAPSKSFSLSPQQSVRYVDVLSSLFGFTGAASIRVTPLTGAILVNSRTYNLIGVNTVGLPVGASFGQFVPALPETEAIGSTQEGRLIQLTHRDSTTLDGFRSNVGYVNATGSPIDLRIDLYKSDGTLLGTIQDGRTHLRAWEFKQINGVFSAFASTLDGGYAVIRTTTAAGRFFAFATVIDNHLTGDPVCVPAIRLAASGVPSTTPTPTPSATSTPSAGGVSVAVSPGAVTLTPGGRQTFRATVTGSSNASVRWSVAEGASGGTVDAAGAYSAPASAGVYHVVATSQADGTKRAQATVVVSTTPVDPAFVPRPVVTPASAILTKEGTVPANTKGSVALSDGTRVDVPPMPGPVTVSVTRSPENVDAVRGAGQDPTGTARVVTYTGDATALDFVPTVTIPAAEAGTISALNVARIGPVVVNGAIRENAVVFLPATRDAGGNVVVRDILMRDAARLAPASATAMSALGIVKRVRSIYNLSTYQARLNWAVDPQLVRMVPHKTDPARRRPLSSLTAKEREDVLRKPVQNVVVLVHGHNEAERFGFEEKEIPSVWGYEYKRDVWTLLYEKFQASYADYADCTAFYEYVYPTYRPVFAGSGALGAHLARLLGEDEKLKKQTAKYNLMFVAHSMGGLVARSAVNQLPSAVAPNFEKLVTWGSPHHGSPVVTFRYLLTSGYNLYVPGMCATGSTLPLTAFNQLGVYSGVVQSEGAVDTPGERELRWDNSKPLELEGIGWRRATWQEGDDVRWDPARNPDLYNAPLLAFNKSDKFYLSDKYVALYGLTSQIAPIDVTNCTSLVNFVRSKPIPQGAGINRWTYNNAATLDAYPGKPSVKQSDGAVPVDSMVGLGVFSAFNTYPLGDTDHEQYYGATVGGAPTAREKGESTATWTLSLLKLKEATNKKCDCPSIALTSLQTSGTNKLVSGKVVWPGDTTPGKRVARIDLVRVVSGTRTVTAASPFTIRDDGTFDATFPANLFEGGSDTPAVAAVLKDGGELSVPAMQLVRLTMTYPGRTMTDLRLPQPIMAIEAGIEAEKVKLLSQEGCCTAKLLVQGSGLNVKHNLWFRIVRIDPASFFPKEVCSGSTCRKVEWIGFTKATSSPYYGDSQTITNIGATLRWDGVEIGQGVTSPIATGFAPYFKMTYKEWDKESGTVCTSPLFCPPTMEDYYPFRIELVTKE